MLQMSLPGQSIRRGTAFLGAVVRLRTAVETATPWGLVASAASIVQTWATEAAGRRRTQRTLRPLEDAGWRVHAVELPGGGGFDHVVVGPSGVFVIASRSWDGLVTVDHKGATITAPDDPGAAWTARGQHRELPPAAAAVVRILAEATGCPLSAPRAVVAVWAEFPDGVAAAGGVSYVAGERLAPWLAEQPHRLDEHHLAALSEVDLRSCLTDARVVRTPTSRLPSDPRERRVAHVSAHHAASA